MKFYSYVYDLIWFDFKIMLDIEDNRYLLLD